VPLLIAPSRRGKRRGIIRLKRERFRQQLERLIDVVWHAGMSIRIGAQIEAIGVEIFHALALGALYLYPAQSRLDGADHAHRDLVLEFEDVVALTIVALGPDVRAGGRIDQLADNADPVAGF